MELASKLGLTGLIYIVEITTPAGKIVTHGVYKTERSAREALAALPVSMTAQLQTVWLREAP